MADHLSRLISDHEWSLRLDMVNDNFQRWGIPLIDLFVTKSDRKCMQFCSFQNQNLWSIADGFLIQWTGHLFYAFPLIQKVLLKVKRDRSS